MFVAQFLVLVVVRGAVDLGDLDLLVCGEGSTKLIPGRGKPLAVAAPGSKEYDEGDTLNKCHELNEAINDLVNRQSFSHFN